MKLLRIDTSMRTQDSITRQLADETIAQLAQLGNHTVVERDLCQTIVPQIDEQWIGANFTPSGQRSAEQQATLALSDQLIAEVQASDLLLMAVPTYNFSVPAAMKAWIDQICRAGITFKYTEQGPVGLLENKKAVVVMASGGTPFGSDIDFVSPYLTQVLHFIGIDDVHFVVADRIVADAERITQAREQIAALKDFV